MYQLLNERVVESSESFMLETLGQRALILRKDLSYSQRDVVDYLRGYAVEIDYSHYSRIENDHAVFLRTNPQSVFLSPTPPPWVSP